ncbi:MAG: acetolactate synthase small subunit [Bacteroidales bacterium]|nr:acetolactate synthase small subunit [Bacteroidales bacterium]
MVMEKLYTITALSENEVGLLNQISIIFTRRKLNIESLSVSASAIHGVHKFVITTNCDEEMAIKVVNQIEKKIDVIRAFYYAEEDIVYQEVALYKVSTPALLEAGGLEKLVRKYNARILEIHPVYTIIEKTGHTEETEALFRDLDKYGVLQFVKSGRVSITKSTIEHVDKYLECQELRRKELEE